MHLSLFLSRSLFFLTFPLNLWQQLLKTKEGRRIPKHFSNMMLFHLYSRNDSLQYMILTCDEEGQTLKTSIFRYVSVRSFLWVLVCCGLMSLDPDWWMDKLPEGLKSTLIPLNLLLPSQHAWLNWLWEILGNFYISCWYVLCLEAAGSRSDTWTLLRDVVDSLNSSCQEGSSS